MNWYDGVSEMMNCCDVVGETLNAYVGNAVIGCDVRDLNNCYDGVGDLMNCCDGVGEVMNCCDCVGDPVNRFVGDQVNLCCFR